jgi:hypothetical protein
MKPDEYQEVLVKIFGEKYVAEKVLPILSSIDSE